MISGKTKSGFKYSVDENKLKSKAFQKVIIRLNQAAKSDDTEAIVMAEDAYEVFILGEGQQEELISHCDKRSETGYATIEEVQNEVNEIVAAVSEKSKAVKN